MRGNAADGTRGASERCADGHGRRQLAVRCVETRLYQVLALWLRDERLELGCRERVYETRFGDDKQQYLSTSKCGELVRLSRQHTSEGRAMKS